jgi:hypothetical protein
LAITAPSPDSLKLGAWSFFPIGPAQLAVRLSRFSSVLIRAHPWLKNQFAVCSLAKTLNLQIDPFLAGCYAFSPFPNGFYATHHFSSG